MAPIPVRRRSQKDGKGGTQAGGLSCISAFTANHTANRSLVTAQISSQPISLLEGVLFACTSITMREAPSKAGWSYFHEATRQEIGRIIGSGSPPTEE